MLYIYGKEHFNLFFDKLHIYIDIIMTCKTSWHLPGTWDHR